MSDYHVDHDELELFAFKLQAGFVACVAMEEEATLEAASSGMRKSRTSDACRALAEVFERARRTAGTHAEHHVLGLKAISRAYRDQEADAQTAIRSFFEGRIK